MSTETPQICIDLDGTLAVYDGWKGKGHIGEPIEFAREFLTNLHHLGLYVIIYTTRCCTRNNVRLNDDWSGKEVAVERVTKWLIKHDMYFDEVYAGQGKPFAIAYVDDRAVVCRPQIYKDANEGLPMIQYVYKQSLDHVKFLLTEHKERHIESP